MRCEEASELLSAYFDGELSTTRQTEVAQHVTSCDRCQRELMRFQQLSEMASRLDRAVSPDVWHGIERSLSGTEQPISSSAHGTAKRGPTYAGRRPIAWWVAASLLFAVLAGMWAIRFRGILQPSEMSAQMAPFFAEFVVEPDAAQSKLLKRYKSKATTFEQVVELLDFRPAASRTLQAGYSVEGVRLFDMPCCKCLQTMLRSKNGDLVCIFEHDGHHPILSSSGPCILADCHGRETKVMQLDGRLAASWGNGKRCVTLIGPSRLEELIELVQSLEASPPGNS